MAFSAEVNKNGNSTVVLLSNDAEKTSAEIYAFGALLNNFSLNGLNVIDGFSSPENAKEDITNGFKSARLSPFVCRLADSKYSVNNEQYTINKFSLGNEAIHGLLYDAVFTVTDYGADENAAIVTLQYDYKQTNEGYPFKYSCIIIYRLESKGKLSVETIIQNNTADAMPLCDGWHPYFTLGCKTDELLMKINSNRMVEFNNNLLPTGKIIAYDKFQQPELIAGTALDNCFLLNENDLPACTLHNNTSGLQLTILPEKSYPYLQLYIPPHRTSIAIENLSAAPDAFNNKMGLIMLRPGQSTSFKTSFKIIIE
ncbi:aldose 1-epimerase [Parafilimonas terrae]|uniref:Aldose 1-epimerase n=1 Tax=Parafilimonas terrae TaxID=1465490 RepID=A0A1I5Z377_9BACT|nr:aldose 1-epimerase [Parafilimonas terrae]SFQ50936.1 aldose 1-epimerase [Parafilimonas terrae]